MTTVDPNPNPLDPNDVIVIQDPLPVTDPPAPTGRPPKAEKTFTAAEVEKIRQEEKEKMYSRLGAVDDLQSELQTLKEEREAERKAREKLEKDAASAAKKKAEEEMDLRQLIEQKAEEHRQELEAERTERKKLEAVYDKEREFSRLQQYLFNRVTEEEDEIMPQLRDFIAGNTQEEIDASIELAKLKTAEIMGNFQQRVNGQRAAQPGVSASGAPPIGPMESGESFRTMTAEDIAALDPQQYAAMRPQLMAAQRNMRNGR